MPGIGIGIRIALLTSRVDTVAPSLSSAEVGGVADTLLVLTYDEALDTGSVPATGDFAVDDGAANAVTNVAVTGRTVRLTLTRAVDEGDTVTVDYTPGTNKIQDASANAAAALSSQAVTNNVVAEDVYMLDGDGNRVKDSYGNDIKLPN